MSKSADHWGSAENEKRKEFIKRYKPFRNFCSDVLNAWNTANPNYIKYKKQVLGLLDRVTIEVYLGLC